MSFTQRSSHIFSQHPFGPLGDQAVEAIRPYGIAVAQARISQRAAFVHSLTVSETAVEFEPEGVAAEETRALYQLACEQAGMITRNKKYQGGQDYMSKKASLAAALQPFDRAPAVVETSTAGVAQPHRERQRSKAGEERTVSTQAPSRIGKKALIGYFDPGVSKQLKRMALDRESTVQGLLAEALNDFFQKHKKPTIA